MPAKSKKQENFMQAVANNPAFAKKVGVPSKVGREFTKGSDMKSKPKKYAAGGQTTGQPVRPGRTTGMGQPMMKTGGTVQKFAFGGMPTNRMPAQVNLPSQATMPLAMPVQSALGSGNTLQGTLGSTSAAPGINQATAASGRDFSNIANGRFAPPAPPTSLPVGEPQPAATNQPVFKQGGKVSKYQVGGAVLPSQAAPQAAQGMARRPAMPTQAANAGARKYKVGGSVARKSIDGIAQKGKTRCKVC